MKIANVLGNHRKKLYPLISPLNNNVSKVSSASFATRGTKVNDKEGSNAHFEGIFIFSKTRVRSEGFVMAKKKEKANAPDNNRIINNMARLNPAKINVKSPKNSRNGKIALIKSNIPLRLPKIIFSINIRIKTPNRIYGDCPSIITN
jgi:hypothetical protein